MKRALFIANLLLVAGIAYFGVQALYRLAALPLAPAPRPAPGPRAPEAADGEDARPRGFYQAIVDRNLFDTRREESPPQEAPDLEALTRTGLKLTLRGTVAGDADRAYAVIEDAPEGRQQLYRPGDDIKGAAIRMILREKVVLRVDGRDEVLAMAEPGETPGAPPPEAPEAPGPDRSSMEIALKGDEIAAALGDLHDLAQQATIRPNFNRGQRDGFLLARVQPASLFSRLGLQTGDVIKTVDGQPITSVGEALSLYKSLTPGNRVEVVISRQGNDQTLAFAIE